MTYQQVIGLCRRVSAQSLVIGVGLLASACGGEADYTVEVSELERRERLPSWEEFERQSRRTSADGELYYVVQGDIPLHNDAELLDYYHQLTGDVEKGVLHIHAGADDVWQNGDQLRLRYCVDTAFDAAPVGASFAVMVQATQAAMFAWQQVANVRFEYDPGNNGNCGRTSPIPDARYIKVSRDNSLSGACAFGPLSHSAWTCPGLDGNTIGVGPNVTLPPGSSWFYMMMHELGHVLGLHHEFFHSGGGCAAGGVRDVTVAVDSPSVMGYAPAWEPSCSLTDPLMTRLSEGDGWTVRQFYGMPAAWYVPIL